LKLLLKHGIKEKLIANRVRIEPRGEIFEMLLNYLNVVELLILELIVEFAFCVAYRQTSLLCIIASS